MLDHRDPLIALADAIDWSFFHKEFAVFYAEEGRPAKRIRLMVGLLLLKQIENLSDERVVLEWKRNPYYQYFCGMQEYVPALPCHATELVKFRQRIGVEGVELIFSQSVALHGKAAEEPEVIVDTTVQEKHITYPTDGKLAIRMIAHLHRIAKEEGIRLRRSFVREIKEHRINLRYFRHPKRSKKARASMKRLRTIVGVLIRELGRKLSEERLMNYQEEFELFEKVIAQQPKDKNKVYSLHEAHVYAIAKGKDRTKYEYGTKASIVMTQKSGIIVGVSAHEKNEHDSKTLEKALEHAATHRKTPIKKATGDRGYRGAREVGGVTICIPGTPKKSDTRYQKEKKRKRFRRRSAIEPVIGHLKADHRLSRNYLKGFIGDEINLLLAAAAFNMKKWMNLFLALWILFNMMLLIYALRRIFHSRKERYDALSLALLRCMR